MITSTLPALSNAETWQDILEFIDDETEVAWFTVASPPDEITVKLRDPDTHDTVLSGSLTGGEIAIVADGVAEFTFTASAFSAVNPKTYEVGVIYEDDDFKVQVILGHLPVLSGL